MKENVEINSTINGDERLCSVFLIMKMQLN